MVPTSPSSCPLYIQESNFPAHSGVADSKWLILTNLALEYPKQLFPHAPSKRELPNFQQLSQMPSP